MASKVYYANFRATNRENLPKKLARLVKTAGMLEGIDFDGKFTAIKIHFGEPGNLSYLRPNYSKVIIDLIKEAGGRPFLTDCNTLYVGRRKKHWTTLTQPTKTATTPLLPAAMSSSQTV